MGKLQTPRANAATEDSAGYRPALDAYARGLISRIQRDQSDTAAVLALKAHYEAHHDLPSLTNLMEGWARTLPEPDAAADAYVAAADAALAARDRARARWLYRHALECSPRHERARLRLDALDEAARSVPPPPPRRAPEHGSTAPRPVSEIRSIEGDAVWLEDADLKPLDDGAPRGCRYEETQRIWRPQAR
jgi:hypothetical protein